MRNGWRWSTCSPLFIVAQGLFSDLDPDAVSGLLGRWRRACPAPSWCSIPFTWLSRSTLLGPNQTSIYRVPRMPWGIARDDIEPTLRRWCPGLGPVEILPYAEHDRGEAFSGKALRGLKDWEQPEVINTDKAPTYAAALAELKAEGKCPKDTQHRQVKHSNNIVEADHGKLKQPIRPVRGFKSMKKTAYATRSRALR